MQRPFRNYLVAAIAAIAVTACSSSAQQTESDDQPTASEQRSTEASGESTGGSSGSDESNADRVTLANLIGSEVAAGLPEGCPKSWQELKERDYDGTVYACSGFRVPKIYREPTIQIGVRDNIVRRITLQAFYESGNPVVRKYEKVLDRYQQRCDAQGAGGDAMTFHCDGYVAEVSHRERAGSLRVILGLENWDLPQ